jgi:hypothetical protein
MTEIGLLMVGTALALVQVLPANAWMRGGGGYGGAP